VELVSRIFVVSLDVSECESGLAYCPKNSVCVNTYGAYKCVCDEGFVKLGLRCEGKTVYRFTSKYFWSTF